MPERVSDRELLAALTEVFRANGYEGTTLAMVGEATGLRKSSLYHRFPGGKRQMAEMVLEAATAHLESHVLEPLRGTGSVRARVKKTAARIAEFYGHGQKACLLDTLSFGGAVDEALRGPMRRAYDAWIGALSAAAIEAGLSKREARARAEEAVLRLEGALVVSRVRGDAGPFAALLAGLPDLLCKP